MSNQRLINIPRDFVYNAAQLARQCSSEQARERALVSQTVALAVRSYLEETASLNTEEGRSSGLKFLELLDVCDFKVNDWQLEVRVLTNVKEPALYVPTMPLMVGVLSDFYLCAQVDTNLTGVEIVGYAPRGALAQADLSANGLMAVLPADELEPFEILPEALRARREMDPDEIRLFDEWQARADRIVRGLSHLLTAEEAFDGEQAEQLAARLYDDVLRIYGRKIAPTGLEPLFHKLFERFGMEEPVPAHPRSPVAFANAVRDRRTSDSAETHQRFFRDDLGVRGRIGLYRHLLEDEDALNEHRRAKQVLDAATGGKVHAPRRRQAHVRKVKEHRGVASAKTPPPPPATTQQERDEINEWHAEFDSSRMRGAKPVDQNQIKGIGMIVDQLKPNAVVRGPIFPEPVQVIMVVPMGESIKLIGKGLKTGLVHEPVLNSQQVAMLESTPENEPFDGDPFRFRLGIEALRLGLAYEYDPYFALSIARVDPLPHQLEAVYEYFLKTPRIRFLLADDPGAGKTIMAGLLLKELKMRGLVKRTLIVTPASLSFQWQREMKDKFREDFDVVRGDVLRANYGSNPFQEKNQVITSVSWVSIIDDAKDSLLRSNWDLIIVDEAHKMSARSSDDTTYAYDLGKQLSSMTDHYLLMTATPHKGDPKNFCLFLELLDPDVYGDVRSLEDAMRRNSAPFYLRRTKEALITFPDPETGESKKIFTKRNVETIGFHVDADELDFYNDLTEYVEDQSIKASIDDSARGRALTFTMAMLQRRFASSIFAVRRSLQRMQEKRQRILDDPEGYRQEQIAKKRPENFEDLPENEQQQIIADLENVVASVDPAALRAEIQQLGRLIEQAVHLEKREVESKLVKLREEIVRAGVFADPNMKLLIFTEHKDTLDYLVGKLREWGLTVTQIHGSMHVGDRDTPGTRIYAEREFRESAQVMVATEAAGEGINLQFCWFMINYDIPWNPVRLEQRMGRIHRYGQEKDCLIFNFVSVNTREGRVLTKLLDRLKEIRSELGTDHVFDVVGEVFPSNLLEKMFRDMYAHNLTEEAIKARIVAEVDVERFKQITHSTLEGLAKRDLNISAIVGKSTEARERRLVPEVVEDFFLSAAPLTGVQPKEVRSKSHIYRVGKVPRTLWAIGDELEPRFGRLGREYKQIVFDKEGLKKEPTSEWVTPGHPLFEAVREDVSAQVTSDLRRGSVFYDLNTERPYRLDVFTASIKDGRGKHLHRRLFAVQSETDGTLSVKQPTVFLDLALAPKGTATPDDDFANNLPDRATAEQTLIEQALNPLLEEVAAERARETETIARHVELSLNVLIDRQQNRIADLEGQHASGDTSPLIAANLKTTYDRLEELTNRLERREAELAQERQCTIGDIAFVGSSWVLPHPERTSPEIAPMVRDEEIERIAVQAVIAHEQAQGREVESVESQNKGFDLVSRLPHPEDPKTAMNVRFIEVKGRAGVGKIGLTTNEFKTAERLKEDYWLYVVYNCASKPEIHIVNDPARLRWEPVRIIEHYHVGAEKILSAAKEAE
jgi:superfamily II DNA or RNA helicase